MDLTQRERRMERGELEKGPQRNRKQGATASKCGESSRPGAVGSQFSKPSVFYKATLHPKLSDFKDFNVRFS